MLTDGWFLKLSETGVLTRAGKALTKVEIFLKYSLKCVAAWIFSQKHVSRTIAFHVIHISWSKHESKVEIFLKYSWKCVFRLNFFTKTCLTNNYLSCDPHFVILEWVQSWNVFEKLMKQCCLLDFFHKNILTNNFFSLDPHFAILACVQSWNIREKHVKLWSPPEFLHENMSDEQLSFMWSTLRDSGMGTM